MAITFHHQRLANGLTIIAECNPDAYTSCVGFYVKAGTRDEDRRLMGVSHFLEHMMFKGTARRTAEDVNREFDQIGANYNAFTSHENTVYYAQVLPEYLPRAVDLLGDMLRPALRTQDFDMEKNVILEEIGMYDDRPQWRLQDALLEHYFNGHPLSFRVLGTVDSIRALACDQMRRYFEHRYSPDNITVAAAGKIQFDRLVQDVNAIAGSWKPTGATRDYQQPQVALVQQSMSDPKLNRHYIMSISPGPSAQDDRRYAARVMTDVLGDTDSSRLHWALVDPGLADEASFSYEPQDQVGCFIGFASCDPQRRQQVEQILHQAVDRLAEGMDQPEIERAKNKIATQATLHGEFPMGRMHHLGSTWTYHGRYIPLEQELDRYMAVSRDDIMALLADMPLNQRTVVRLGPEN